MKILIVEDNPAMREMLCTFIGKLCERIIECTDGCDALEAYREHLPDWVLMDWEMKQMDGITAAKQIIGQFPDAHICMVTSYNDVELQTAAINAGAAGFVVKDDLSKLRKVLAA